MNYNYPYGPANYYPQYQQNSYYGTQTQGTAVPTQQLNVYAFVDGIEGAKAYIVRPGTKMLLMESQGNVCYLKQVNDQGQTIAFETYDLVKRDSSIQENKVYITKEEFEKEICAIKALIAKDDK